MHLNVNALSAPPPPPPPPYQQTGAQPSNGGLPPYQTPGHGSQPDALAPPFYPAAHHHHHHHHHLGSPTRRNHNVTNEENYSESIDPAKYKTRLCTAYIMGMHCTFGSRCAFAHGNGELRHAHSPSLPPPPSYQEAVHPPQTQPSAGPSSPLHSRPQTPRSANPTVTAGDALMSPSKVMHPRNPNSLPASPVTQQEGGFPVTGHRFRNEPYSPTGFVYQQQGADGELKELKDFPIPSKTPQ